MLSKKKMSAAILKLLDIVAEEAPELFEEDQDTDYGQPMQDICNGIAAKFQTVYQYTVSSGNAVGVDYRGKDLFDQRACRIYQQCDLSYGGPIMASRTQEVWLLEDMTLMVVDVLTTSVGEKDERYHTEYRAAVNTVEDGDDLCFSYKGIMESIEEFAKEGYYENAILYAL